MELTEEILKAIDNSGNPLDSIALASKLNVDHQKLVGAIKSLESLGDVIKTEIVSQKCFELTKEGNEVAANGSHEAVTFKAIPEEGKGIPQSDLMKAVGSGWAKVGCN